MNLNGWRVFRPLKVWRPSLRVRLALWSAGLLFVASGGLTLFINVATTATTPRSATAVAVLDDASPVPSELPTLMLTPPATQARLPMPLPVGFMPPEVAVLRQMHIFSLVGLGLVAVLGGAGIYWVSGRALRPVREVSQVARRIRAGALNTRLALDGPDDELKELADAFDGMLERLERAFEQQSRFVTDAAHELRTPLATLRTNLEVACSNPTATLGDYREMTETLERSLRQLERLVENLLILATEDRAVVKSEFALGPLLEDVLLDLQPVADKQAVTLRYTGEIHLTVQGDESLLRRVFYNLIENGIRYNRPGGEVVVTIRQEGVWAIVVVADTGMGISPAEQAHIFDRFYRGSRSQARHKGGVGLGLSIVAHIVQQHGGQVQVDSTPGVGSTFTVQLPA